MKEVAEIMGVHESTISRLANSKYIKCDWGLFEIKYFFSNSVSGNLTEKSNTISHSKDSQGAASHNTDSVSDAGHTSSGLESSQQLPVSESISRSQESIKFELAHIIQQQRLEKPDSKPLSDQKLADLLYEKTGIKIARRTVAKYRNSLNIESSYTRK